jgi:anti-anti-sigma factor
MLQLFVERSGDTVILKCRGRIVAGNSLRALQRAATSQPASGLVIDLAEVEILDAAGLGALVRLRQHCESQGTSLKLINPNKHVREVLTLTALDSVLEVHPAESQAALEDLLREWACAER